MSLLPQHKKSADEIAKLRESLGITGPPPVVAGNLPVEIPVVAAAPKVEAPGPAPEIAVAPVMVKLAELPAASPLAPLPAAEDHPAKQVRSLRRSERIPVLPVEESGPPPHHPPHPPDGPAIPIQSPLPDPHGPKSVRSLRKSEQTPLAPVHAPAPDSKLPIHRHSDKELNQIRRHDALAALNPAAHPHSLTAHLALVIPGYLFAIVGAVSFYFYDLERQEMRITAGCAVVALLVAAFIFFRKPLSRHHAAFIGVITLFVIIFGALHYFPQLRHGT